MNRCGDLDSYDEFSYSNPILMLKYPDKFKQNFYQSAKKSLLLLESQDYEQSILYLNKTLDLLQLGKDVLKGISLYWKICIYGNFACAYQKRLWEVDRCAKYCEKIQNELKRLFQEEGRKQYRLNLTKELIKIKFQRCALLSQLNKHQASIEICKSIFPLLQIFLVVVQAHIEGKLKNQKAKKSRDNISFMQEVYEFSKKVNHNLLSSVKDFALTEPKQSFYYWPKNPQKNQEQVLRKFVGIKENGNWKKSILGVTKSKSWLNDFNISNVMNISQFCIEDFEKPTPIQEYVFRQKIYESVIYCSLAHFTLATQMRFIEFNKQRQEIDKKWKYSTKMESISKKYGYEDKSEHFLISESHHLKAIKIISTNLQFSIPYLSHIIRSYEKHYINNRPLEKISSIAQQSGLSMTVTKQRHYENDFQLRSSSHKKKKSSNQKNAVSPPKILKEKKYCFAKMERKNDFLLCLKNRKQNNKSSSKSKSKKKKCISADRKKSSQNFSGKKRKKTPDNHISLFDIYGKISEKELKVKQDLKSSTGDKKRTMINKIK